MEIKFKGWHTGMNTMFSCEKMVRDQMTLLTDGRFINVSGADLKASVIYDPAKFIPLQYTGRKDGNGKEIYKSDIVKECGNPDMFGEVVFRDCSFGYIHRGKSNKDYNKGDFVRGLNSVEVIGNIYEIPKVKNAVDMYKTVLGQVENK